MTADVSRALARFTSYLGLSQAAARELAARFADVDSADDLPEWIREIAEPVDPTLDEIEAMATEPDEAERAAGADVTPGHDELHHYWTRGEGLARWAGSPTPWRTLLALLVEHVKPPKPLGVLKRWTSRWFIEVFGYAAGSDKNRVAHGHPPRGNRVGPG